MSLTAYSSLKIGEKKIFHELDVHHVQKVGSNVFGLAEIESKCHQLAKKENFS